MPKLTKPTSAGGTINSALCWREYNFDGLFNAWSKLFKSLASEACGCSTFVQRTLITPLAELLADQVDVV
jgi:hypothetical protein